jgi:hypothetical protein
MKLKHLKKIVEALPEANIKNNVVIELTDKNNVVFGEIDPINNDITLFKDHESFEAIKARCDEVGMFEGFDLELNRELLYDEI